ncbi:uncharacterized protein LOC127005363 isoform X2 [Eriocheir sinensis]|nr:uncharacterized protein LOC127005363 isoform X2 [Eriocheir sinensis]XP_050730119.1 uncharacterized protein LOC127005363 isoform X2 [Eriocheir sinensis]
MGPWEYRRLLPPLTRPLQKYSSILSAHLQEQGEGRLGKGRESEAGTDTSAGGVSASSDSSSSFSSSSEGSAVRYPSLSPPSSSSSFPSSSISGLSSPSSSSSSSSVGGSSVRYPPPAPPFPSSLSVSGSPPPPPPPSPPSSPFSSSTRALVEALVGLVEEVELPCAKLLMQGGRTCQRLPDGDKKVCSDPAVAPTWSSCLVYSFGLGHDFSFDAAMALMGCEVFVFDDDDLHDMYPSHPFPRIHFGHVRLGSRVLYQVVEDKVKNSTYAYLYRPLDNLMYVLGHAAATIDLLKVDIEGAEWEVFQESIFKTNILERTKQLAIEIHMIDFLKPNITLEETETALHKYISFFKGLRSRGFQLAHHEPNYISPTFTTVQGVTFSILAEQLWINTRIALTHPPPPRPRNAHAHAPNPHAYAIRAIDYVGDYEFE